MEAPILVINTKNKTKEEIVDLHKEYAARAVLFDEKGDVILISSDEPKLLGNRYFEIPGGRIEKGEDKENACKREIKEESGFVVENIQYIGQIDVVKNNELSIVYGYVAQVISTSQKETELTDEEKKANYKVEIFSFNKAVEILANQCTKAYEGPTLRNLMLILEAQRFLMNK